MNLIPIAEPPQTPAAQAAATSLLAHVNAELARRVDYHAARYADFWDSQIRPDDILAAMGKQATIMLAAAAENVEHIARLAAIVGKQVTDFLPAEQWQPRRAFQPQPDGSATLAPPADGYDDWGRAIPVAADPVDNIAESEDLPVIQ